MTCKISTRRGFTQRSYLTGFTLIELLVVVLIIGILTAVAVPRYQVMAEKSRAMEAITLLNSLQKSIDLYVLENGYQSINFLTDSGRGQLSVDLSHLDCTQRNGTACGNKRDFVYEDIWCNESYCALRASRRKNGIFSNAQIYSLYMQKTSSKNGKWMRACFYTPPAYTQKLCKELGTVGWGYNAGA